MEFKSPARNSNMYMYHAIHDKTAQRDEARVRRR